MSEAEFEEGGLIVWRPSEPGSPPSGHLLRWELAPVDDAHARVTHTYDWSQLTDEKRFVRARATGVDALMSSLMRLAVSPNKVERQRFSANARSEST